jgi:hypothetical protein
MMNNWPKVCFKNNTVEDIHSTKFRAVATGYRNRSFQKMKHQYLEEMYSCRVISRHEGQLYKFEFTDKEKYDNIIKTTKVLWICYRIKLE